MQIVFICLLLICLGVGLAPAQTLIGQLEPDFIALSAAETTLQSASAAALPSGISVSEGDRLFAGQLRLRALVGLVKGGNVKVIFVDPKAGAPWLLADVNLDGFISASERFTFEPCKDPRCAQRLVLRIQLPGPPARIQAMVVQIPKDATPDGARRLITSLEAGLRGTVEIGGQRTLVQLPFDLLENQIRLGRNYLLVDTNGDGKFDRSLLSLEEAFVGNGEQVVLRVGQHYVSVESANPGKRELVMREHPAADYKRVEIVLGRELPNFSFTDLAGRNHSLAEFHGKYVLISYWSPMCGWALEEVPNVKAAYERYRPRGFEIIGLLPSDENLEALRAFVAQEGITWPNATPESVREVVDQRLRLLETPTLLLLDPEGRVISRDKEGDPPLRGPYLANTLERVLPPARPGG